MKRVYPFIIFAISTCLAQSAPVQCPKITGIDHVAFYTTDAQTNLHLYSVVLGLPAAASLEPGETQRFMVGSQWVGYSPAPNANATDRMDHVAFSTDDVTALRSYLTAHGVK